jgi:hypothetical protein
MTRVVLACAGLLMCHVSVAATELAQACRAVRHPQLEALLPNLPDFVRDMPVSETDDVEAVSRTTVDYEAGIARISIELMDSCRNPDMLSQLREFRATGAPASLGTTMRSVAIRGFPAYEEWTAESRHGEVHVLVADRFMVKVTGDSVASLAALEAAAQAIELQRLAALK